ncbi:AMP-binding protein [Streptomyces sp. NPDC005549]|uniref:AMP-binding protein n=1 Tax=Streptomyces sp. NPDC005549 TaxID=3154888 RepID=UPI0033B405A7
MSVITNFFDTGALSHPDSVCFEDQAGTKLTYSEVVGVTSQVARAVKDRGLGEGYHGAVLSGNIITALVAILGVCRGGGVWLPVNARNSAVDNASFLDDMDCEVLFYQEKWADQVEVIREQVPSIKLFVCLDGEGDDSLAGFIDEYSSEPVTPNWDLDATQLIMGTGGTTGRPKGAMLSSRNLAAAYAIHMSVFAIDAQMTVLAAAPISHTSAILAVPYLARGGRLYLVDGVEPQSLMRDIEDQRVNMMFLPPTVLYMLLAEPNVREFDFSSLKYILYGAAPTAPQKLREAIEVFGPVMLQGYGQMEVMSGISALVPDDHFIDGKPAPDSRLMSAGRRHPFTRVALRTDDDQITTEPGITGEIIVQGDVVMKGYYNNPRASEESSFNGWHCTGDIGVFDEEGFLTLVDRKKDMIISGGFNVFSTEVEASIMSHALVKDCAVIGVPHEKWGEAVTAFIEVRPGADLDPEELRLYVRERLGGVKTPKTIHVLDELPRSTVGKVLKKELRQLRQM